MGLLATYAGQEPDLRPWLAGAEINRDGNLRLQYLAGLALNISMEGSIYNDILNLPPFPAEPVHGIGPAPAGAAKRDPTDGRARRPFLPSTVHRWTRSSPARGMAKEQKIRYLEDDEFVGFNLSFAIGPGAVNERGDVHARPGVSF